MICVNNFFGLNVWNLVAGDAIVLHYVCLFVCYVSDAIFLMTPAPETNTHIPVLFIFRLTIYAVVKSISASNTHTHSIFNSVSKFCRPWLNMNQTDIILSQLKSKLKFLFLFSFFIVQCTHKSSHHTHMEDTHTHSRKCIPFIICIMDPSMVHTTTKLRPISNLQRIHDDTQKRTLNATKWTRSNRRIYRSSSSSRLIVRMYTEIESGRRKGGGGGDKWRRKIDVIFYFWFNKWQHQNK